MNINRAALNLSSRTKRSKLGANFGQPLQDVFTKSFSLASSSSCKSSSITATASASASTSTSIISSSAYDKANMEEIIDPLKQDVLNNRNQEEKKIRKPLLSFPGGGIYFYWQLGVIHYLRHKKYDLDNVQFVGASAGALTSTLVACNVDIIKATDLAIQLAAKHDIWKRGLGLVGIWGEIVEEWLDRLLPRNAHEICNKKIHLFVTKIGYPYPERISINYFNSREELIKVNMASVHIPYVMNKSIFRSINIESNTNESDQIREAKKMNKTQAEKDIDVVQNVQEDITSTNNSNAWFNNIISPFADAATIPPTPPTIVATTATTTSNQQFSQNKNAISKSKSSSFSSTFSIPNFYTSSFFSFQKFKEREPSAPKFATTSSEYIKSSSSMSTMGITASSSFISPTNSNTEAKPTKVESKKFQPTFLKSFLSSTTQYTSGRNKRKKIDVITLTSQQDPAPKELAGEQTLTKNSEEVIDAADSFPTASMATNESTSIRKENIKKRKRSIDDSFYYIDGSFYLPKHLLYVHGREHPTIILDHQMDQKLHPPKSLFENPLKFIEAITPNRLHELIKIGYSYGEKLDKENSFASLSRNE